MNIPIISTSLIEVYKNVYIYKDNIHSIYSGKLKLEPSLQDRDKDFFAYLKPNYSIFTVGSLEVARHVIDLRHRKLMKTYR